MAVTKASASGLAGSKFKDASAGTTKIPDIPDTPIIGTAVNSGAQASVPFTIRTTGGTATSFTATSSPSGLTASGSSSPIVFQNLAANTAYTFTITASNSSGTSPASSASNTVTTISDPVWQVNSPLTFNTTQNYFADGNVTQIAMMTFSGGFAGNSGGTAQYSGNWGPGGGGSGGAMGQAYSGVTNVPVGGQTHLITIGASGGGVTSVGSALTSSGGGNATSKAAGNVQGGNSTGGNVSVGSGLFTVQTQTYGGRGGNGGSGGGADGFNASGGNAGLSPFGGSGGSGSNNGGGAGGATGGLAAGGGGGGGGGWRNGPGGGGGAGGSGRVIIYEKKSV